MVSLIFVIEETRRGTCLAGVERMRKCQIGTLILRIWSSGEEVNHRGSDLVTKI